MTEKEKTSIKILTRTYYDYQTERTALDGRLGQKKNGEAKKGAPERDDLLLVELLKRRDDVLAMEGVFEKEVAKEVHKLQIWTEYLADVKGVGEMIAAVMVTEFDVAIATTVSKMWQFSGMNPGMVKGRVKKGSKIVVTDDDVRGDRRTKGFLCPYNQFLKAKLLGVLGSSFLKCNSPYREYYDNMKHRLESSDWGTASKNPTDKSRPKAGHQHKAATRYMVKMFLIDFYVAWRTLEGLPVREPYQQQYLKQTHSE